MLLFHDGPKQTHVSGRPRGILLRTDFMSIPKNTTNPALQFVNMAIKWSWLWIGTAVLFGMIGLCYVILLKKDVWVASQGMIVRDEANGAVMRLGRFQSQADMKAAQETIIELAHNPQVIHRALERVGAEPALLMSVDSKSWPSTKDVELAAKKIEVRAPRGAELGTTEVIYLDTKHSSRQRAYDLNVALCDTLEERLQQVRKSRADAVLEELTTARDVAKSELDAVTDKLQAIERKAGEDLSDLRGMTDSNSSANSSRNQLDNVKAELRQAETQLRQMTLDLELAEKAFASPEQLLSPNSLVNSQSGLRKLREGLADARINASQLQGRFTENHPLVLAAFKAEQEIQVRLREELGLARQTLVNDTELLNRRIATLQEQRDELAARIDVLADIRAEYANLVADVRSRSKVVQDTERQLSEVQAARDAAISCSLVTRIDTPFSSETPVGPGRTTILAGSTMAGLFFGFGALFLIAPLENTVVGRRSSDFASAIGRRITDRFPGNRATDVVNVDIASLSAVASAAPTADNRSHSPSGVTRMPPMRRSSDSSSVSRPAAPVAEVTPVAAQPTEAKQVDVKPAEAAATQTTVQPDQQRRPLPPTVPRAR